MKCNKCGQENVASSIFCCECGNKLEKLCPACQQTVTEGMKFCPICGQNLADQSTASVQMKDNVIAGDVNQTVQSYSNHVDQSVHHSVVNIYQAAPTPAPEDKSQATAPPQTQQHDDPHANIENRILLQSAQYRFEVIKVNEKLVSVLNRYPRTPYNQNISLPSYDDMGNPIVEIASKAFHRCLTLQTITFPDSVHTIGAEAFFGCSALTSAQFGKGITTIGRLAFTSCVKLTEIIIPDSVTSIGEGAFQYCQSVRNIKIGNGITKMENWLFAYNNTLQNIVLPNRLETIGEGAFFNCGFLAEINIPEGVTHIGRNAFYSCRALKSVTIPVSLKNPGQGAFSQCSSLKQIKYNGTVAQWNANIGDARKFLGAVPTTQVICTDGIVTFKKKLF